MYLICLEVLLQNNRPWFEKKKQRKNQELQLYFMVTENDNTLRLITNNFSDFENLKQSSLADVKIQILKN